MVSRENKRAARGHLHEKLQLLRSVTNSHAVDKTSIISDVSKYIEELKEKVEKLNRDVTNSQSLIDQVPSPMIKVESIDRGFLVDVYAERSYPGLLVSVLEAFEELNLGLVEARASCEDFFHLEAFGTQRQGAGQPIDGQIVRQAVLQAINKDKEANAD
ncbi:hypothetical protein Droror1_Dr00020479 [Drosera rotundifolia]